MSIIIDNGTYPPDCASRTHCACGAPVKVEPCTWENGIATQWRMTYDPVTTQALHGEAWEADGIAEAIKLGKLQGHEVFYTTPRDVPAGMVLNSATLTRWQTLIDHAPSEVQAEITSMLAALPGDGSAQGGATTGQVPESLLRKPGPLPLGCYCKPGRCLAPVTMGQQTSCRDPVKAAMKATPPASTQGDDHAD